jgi:hypothetical protein
MFRFVLISLALSQADLSNAKFDYVCYSPYSCEYLQQELEDDEPELMAHMGAFLYADSSNLSSVIGQAPNYYLFLFIGVVPTGVGEDIVDLGKLNGHKVVEISEDLYTWGRRLPSFEDYLPSPAHDRFPMRLGRSKRGTKSHGPKRNIAAASGIPIKSDSSVYGKVDYLILRGQFDLKTELRLKKLFAGTSIEFDHRNDLSTTLIVDTMLIRPATFH